jgi:hypothetical protein
MILISSLLHIASLSEWYARRGGAIQTWGALRWKSLRSGELRAFHAAPTLRPRSRVVESSYRREYKELGRWWMTRGARRRAAQHRRLFSVFRRLDSTRRFSLAFR